MHTIHHLPKAKHLEIEGLGDSETNHCLYGFAKTLQWPQSSRLKHTTPKNTHVHAMSGQ